MIEATEPAAELLARSGAAARRFNPEACIRVAPGGDGVRFELADGPQPGDVAVEHPEITFYVDATLDGVIDVEQPHDRLVLRLRGQERRLD